MKKSKRIIRAILENLIKLLWVFPIDAKKILFFSFQGKQFSDSPKYLSEYIKLHYENYKLCWAFKDLKDFKYLKDEGYRIIKYGGISFIFYFVTSKIIITNDSVKSFVPVRKKNQIFLNTWHGGSPLKTCGLAESSISSVSDTKKKLEIFEKKYTAYLSSSKFMTEEVFRKSFNFHGQILEFGMPRNAILLSKHDKIKDKVFQHFHLDKKSSLVLYAPTFRDNKDIQFFINKENRLDIQLCIKALEKRFGTRFCFLFRAHHIMSDVVCDDCISATNYSDMQELLCAADVLITDYSSCMGDMALMYKPVFLYVPDLMTYTKERGFYWDINKLPFPLAKSNSELSDVISKFDVQKYDKDLKIYFDKLGSVESVDSVVKTCQWLFKN